MGAQTFFRREAKPIERVAFPESMYIAIAFPESMYIAIAFPESMYIAIESFYLK